MGTGYLIDSNIVIGYLDQTLSPKGMDTVSAIINETPKISVITKIEVLRYNTTVNGYKIISDFINESQVLHLTDRVIDSTIEICKSRKIKLPDAIIAATALVNNLALVTRNISDFKNINGLELLNPWAEDNGKAL